MIRFELDKIIDEDIANDFFIKKIDIDYDKGLLSVYMPGFSDKDTIRTQSLIHDLKTNENIECIVEIEHPTPDHLEKFHPGKGFKPGNYDNHIHLDFYQRNKNSQNNAFNKDIFLADLEKCLNSINEKSLHPALKAAILSQNPNYQACIEQQAIQPQKSFSINTPEALCDLFSLDPCEGDMQGWSDSDDEQDLSYDELEPFKSLSPQFKLSGTKSDQAGDKEQTLSKFAGLRV